MPPLLSSTALRRDVDHKRVPTPATFCRWSRCGAVNVSPSATARRVVLISQFTPVPASIEPWSVALGIGITALVGLFFGLYPAMRAARLDPIEALRRE